MESEHVAKKLPQVICNFAAAREHVGEIEREIQVIEERGCATLNTIPFKKVPRRVITEIVYFVVLWLNAFPPKTGIS